MDEEPQIPPTVSPTDTVYRAARNNSWIKRDVVQEKAFYRGKDRDPSGLSIGTTPEAARRDIRDCGIIQITVADIRSLHLDVRLYATPPDKGNINTSVPFYDDPNQAEVGKAINLARALANLADTYHEPTP